MFLYMGVIRQNWREAEKSLSSLPGAGSVESYLADLSRMADVEALAKAVAEQRTQLDVLINNAGIFHTPEPITQDGLDVRFVVNTIAPYSADAKTFAAYWARPGG